uniref:Secreted protein n=1 Tax=Meloidogyne incognita TaxID=6306 RepID=A0A914N6J0_MELIC
MRRSTCSLSSFTWSLTALTSIMAFSDNLFWYDLILSSFKAFCTSSICLAWLIVSSSVSVVINANFSLISNLIPFLK